MTDPSDGRIDDTPDGSTSPEAAPVLFSACGAFGSGGARAIAAAPTLPRAVVGYGSGRVVLIDTASLSVRLELPAHDRAVTRAAMSKDGQRTATSSETGEIIVSRADDGQQLARIRTGEFPLPRLALSPDGSLVAAQSDDGLRLWRVDDGSLLWSRPDTDQEMLSFLDDGRTLISGGYGLVSFRRVTDGTIEREASFEGKLSDANRDGTLFVGKWSGGFGLWRTGQKAAAWMQSDPDPYDGIRPQLSPDGATLAFKARWSGTRLARVSDGSVLGSFPGLSASLAFDHAGSLLIGDVDGTLHRVSTSAHEEMVVPAPPGHGGPLLQVAFSPDGRLFATNAHEAEDRNYGTGAGEVVTVKVWRAQDGILLFTAPVADVYTRRSFAFSPDSASLAVVGPDSRIRLLQASDGRELAVMGEEVQGVAFTSDGRSLLGSTFPRPDRRAFRRWRATDGAEEPGLGGVGVQAWAFGFSPDGAQFAILTPGSNPALSLWRVTDETLLWSARVLVKSGLAATSVAFSPDGAQVAVSDLQVFAASDGGLIRDLRPSDGDSWWPSSGGVSYSRDGAHVAFAHDGFGGALRVFRTSDWMPVETRPGAFRTVAFSPTEDRLLLGGNDYIVRLLCRQ